MSEATGPSGAERNGTSPARELDIAEKEDRNEEAAPPRLRIVTHNDDRAHDAYSDESVGEDDASLDPKAQRRLRAERERGRSGYSVGSFDVDAERVAGRDYYEHHQHYHYARRTVPGGGPVAPGDLVELRAAYHATEHDGRLRADLASGRLIILRGERDSGRHATALVALDEVTGRERESGLVKILPAPDEPDGLAELLDAGIEKGHGHLVDLTGRPTLTRDEEAAVARLLHRLAEAEAYLIVLTDERTPSKTLRAHFRKHLVPDLRQVIRARLAASTHEMPEVDVGRLLGEAERYADVAEWLTVMRTPEEAVELADVIRKWADRRSTNADAVPEAQSRRYERLKLRAQRQLGGIERVDTPLHQAFSLAAGVFNGASLGLIVEVAEDLTDRLRAVEHPGTTAGGRPVFTDPLAGRLTYAEVRFGAETQDSPATTVELHDPALAGVLLDVVWNQYDAARRCVVEWLAGLCGSGHPVKQARGALAIGRLAAFDYPQIYRDVLEPWSKQDRKGLHQAAAWVLETLYLDGRHRHRVYELLRVWTRGRRWQQRAIAVRAYGTRIGEDHPGEALRDIGDAALLDVAGSHSYRRFVDNALIELYDRDLRGQVLATLYRWRQLPLLRYRAATTFVRLCERLERHRRPELLAALAESPPLTVEELGELWRCTLTSPRTGPRAWAVLRVWLNCAYHDPGNLRPAFDPLLMEITRDQALRTRLDKRRRFWKCQDDARAARFAGRYDEADGQDLDEETDHNEEAGPPATTVKDDHDE